MEVLIDPSLDDEGHA